MQIKVKKKKKERKQKKKKLKPLFLANSCSGVSREQNLTTRKHLFLLSDKEDQYLCRTDKSKGEVSVIRTFNAKAMG